MASIFVVEDERIIAEDLRKSLEQIGHSVVGVFSSGEAALKALKGPQPEIILMDIDLAGEIDGIETAETITSQIDVPIIYLTAYTDSGTIERVKESNPYNYLSKPVDMPYLRAAIEIALYKHTADKRIRESERNFRSTFEQAAVGMCHTDIKGRFLRVNQKLCEILGYSKDELLKMEVRDITHPDDFEREVRPIRRLIKNEISVYSDEKRYLHKDGAMVWVNLTVSNITHNIGEQHYLMAVIEDITERKRAQEALERSEARFRAIYENGPVMVTGFNPDGEIILWNKEVERQLGWSLNEAMSCDVLSLCYPDKAIYEDVKKVIKAREGKFGEYNPITKEGESRRQLWANFSVPDGCVICVGHDITELKESEEALRESEHRHRTLFEKHSAVMLIIDPESGKIIDANPAALDFYGYTRSEIKQLKITDINILPKESIHEEMERARRQRKGYFEFKHRLASGEIRDVDVYSCPVEWHGGATLYSIIHDVTERKKAQEALMENEKKFRLAFEYAPDAIFWADAQSGEILNCNRAAERLLGRSREDIIGCNQTELHSPEQAADYRRWFLSHVHDHRPDVECEVLTIKGEPIPVRVTAKTTEIEGRLILQGVFRDISERKERERKLKESEARLKAIFDFMPALLVAVDSNFNIIAWNKECERVTGFTEDDMVGNPKALEFILPDKSYRADSLNRFKSIGLDFRDEEVTLQTKDGESRIISWSSVTSLCPIPGWSQWAVGIDVTSRKEAENELIATQRRLELAIEAAGLTIWDYDLKTGKAFRDEYWAQRLGYEPEEVEPSIGAWIKLVHPDDIDHVATAFSNHQHGLTPYYETEHRLKSRSGDWFWNLAQAKIVEWDSQGLPSRLTGVSMDITSRKKIELDFQNSEAEKKAILNGISSNVIFLNKDLEIVWANRAAEETYGMSRGNIAGFKCCYHLCFQNRDPHQSCPALRTFQTGRPERNEFEKEDGRIWGAGTSPVFSENGEVTGVVCISKDITDEKKAQEIMVQSEKYKAVADLTAGVAHNFNNLLQIVLGNTDLAVLDLRSADFSSLENNLSEIKRAARFGAETVRRLNRFVRREQPHGEYEIDLFDLSDLVEQVISMSKSVWKTEPEKLGLQVNLDCHLRSGCLVKANKAELFEVILNLIKNAVEALPQGGDIVIRTQRDQDKILLSVQDNGIGIPEENINRLFTPFYTTNAESGRGLGLATCRSVLKAHNGDITVRSQLGVGSLFTVELPYASETVEQAEGCAPSGSGTLSILIVDDNKPILEILKKGLEANGHTVYAALSGQEALKIFDDATLDAVVCDLSMPGMDGWQVGQAIQERRLKSGANPIPFIIFTGWIDEAQDEQKLKASGVDLVVEKPIGPDKLLDILFKLI